MPRRYPEYTPERIKESKSYQVLLPKFNARRWAFGGSEWQDHGVDYSFEYCELPKKSPPKQILGLMRNKKILKIRRFACDFACM